MDGTLLAAVVVGRDESKLQLTFRNFDRHGLEGLGRFQINSLCNKSKQKLRISFDAIIKLATDIESILSGRF